MQTDIFNQLEFKRYDKRVPEMSTGKDDMGLVIENVLELDPENSLNLVEEYNGEEYLHCNKIFVLACIEIQKLRKELNDIKSKM